MPSGRLELNSFQTGLLISHLQTFPPWHINHSTALSKSQESSLIPLFSSSPHQSTSQFCRLRLHPLHPNPSHHHLSPRLLHNLLSGSSASILDHTPLSPGSARFALFLLCCSGALLSSHTAPYMLGPDKQQAIIKELRSSFEKLLNDYQQEERGGPERSQYQMPYFGSEPPAAIQQGLLSHLPYCRAIKPSFHNETQVVAVTDHLSKLEFRHEPETKVSVPTESFKCKKASSCLFLKSFQSV
uniref:Uncharacterized protein n=1 Tax=Balaenoptera musculus TaxID=9771 RepID=A0A8C0DAD5_BALMU